MHGTVPNVEGRRALGAPTKSSETGLCRALHGHVRAKAVPPPSLGRSLVPEGPTGGPGKCEGSKKICTPPREGILVCPDGGKRVQFFDFLFVMALMK